MQIKIKIKVLGTGLECNKNYEFTLISGYEQ